MRVLEVSSDSDIIQSKITQIIMTGEDLSQRFRSSTEGAIRKICDLSYQLNKMKALLLHVPKESNELRMEIERGKTENGEIQ